MQHARNTGLLSGGAELDLYVISVTIGFSHHIFSSIKYRSVPFN